MPPDDPIDLTVEPRDLLPQVVVDEWLPSEEESILFLFQFDRYPPYPSHYILPSDFQSFLHQDEILRFDYQSLLKISPPAHSSISKGYQDAIKNSKSPIHSITLKPYYGISPITVPAWIFVYWTEIERAVNTRKRWKVALEWVHKQSSSPLATELCYRVLLGLASFSWSHGVAYTCDITPLFLDTTEKSYLSSFHIDHMNAQTRLQYERLHGPSVAGRHIFATVDHFDAIISFYSQRHAKKGGPLWDNLMVIENQIIKGEVDGLSGAMYLPSKHWVSVVINFKHQKIFYGDSLGWKIPDHERRALQNWIKHLVGRSIKFPPCDKITFDRLSTGHQVDGTSCGLFALNAIAHHHLGHSLLPSDQITLACRRMEIALVIISSMTVCLFHMVQNIITQHTL